MNAHWNLTRASVIVFVLVSKPISIGLHAEPRPLAEQLVVSMKLYDVPGAQIFVFRLAGHAAREGHAARQGRELSLFRGYRTDGAREKITERTVFEGGALIQPLTALATILFARERAFGLDAPAGPLLGVKNPYAHAPVTLERLLSMTGGLPVSRGRPRHSARAPDLRNYLGAPSVIYKPGSRIVYADAGYGLVQLLLEKWADRPFADMMSRRIFARFNMKATSLSPAGPALRVPVPAADSLRTTARDYGKFLLRLAAAGAGSPEAELLRRRFSYHGDLGGTAPGFNVLLLKKKSAAPTRLFLIEGRRADGAGIAMVIPGKGGAALFANADRPYFLRDMLNVVYAEYFRDVVPARALFTLKKPPKYPIKKTGAPPRDMGGLARFAELEGFYRPEFVLPHSYRFLNFLNDARIDINKKHGLEFSGIFQKDAALELLPLAGDLFFARGNAGMNGWRVRVIRKGGAIVGLDTDRVRFRRVPYIRSAWAIIIGLGLLLILPLFPLLWYFVFRSRQKGVPTSLTL